MQYKIIGELVSDNSSEEYHNDDMWVVQCVDENGDVVGSPKAVLKSRVRGNRIYWDGKNMPKKDSDDSGDILVINGVKYRKVED